MEIELIKTVEQFEQLNKGDSILVKWNDYFVKHTPKSKNIMFYNVYMNKTNSSNTEIICQVKNNHYFNYMRYLEKLSNALEVYKVVEE